MSFNKFIGVCGQDLLQKFCLQTLCDMVVFCFDYVFSTLLGDLNLNGAKVSQNDALPSHGVKPT
jgi:hypothetical protein